MVGLFLFFQERRLKSIDGGGPRRRPDYNQRMPERRRLGCASLRPLLSGGSAAIGIFCELASAEAIEIAGLAGWDFVVIDCEHAPITAQQLPALVRAANAAGIPAVVRVPSNDAAAIQHALDCGSSGVQVPQISTFEAARQALASSRFHPEGLRGFNPFVRAAEFSATPVADFIQHANQETTVVLQVESVEGVECASRILELSGLDVLFIGPYDLSQASGVPGQTLHPKVLAAGRRIIEAARDRNVAVGCFAGTEEEARHWVAAGIRYLCYSVDSVVLLQGMRSGAAAIRDISQTRVPDLTG
jgi:4-hydroxy-2-oxoheptanedioate aldolase